MSRVLIVDDEEAILDVAEDALQTLGHEVLRAHDGDQALKIVRTDPPDLVVSDVMMPRRTGVELWRAMQAEPQLASIPMILMSAARAPAIEGAVTFLPKPLALDAFEHAVERALGCRSTVPADAPSAAVGSARAREDRDVRDAMLEWVAHELKTPLSSVKMNAQLASRRLGADGDPAVTRPIEAVVRGADRMVLLINSILDAARFAEGRVVLRAERKDLRSFVMERVEDWRAQMPAARIELSEPHESVMAVVDSELLRQVFDNLISNAVKYGRGAERIDVTLDVSPGRASITVRDHGPGIPASELPRLFDRFHRVDGAGEHGHGLGLFIAAAIARLHTGVLVARSEVGRGSTFTLTLPRAG